MNRKERIQFLLERGYRLNTAKTAYTREFQVPKNLVKEEGHQVVRFEVEAEYVAGVTKYYDGKWGNSGYLHDDGSFIMDAAW